MSSPIRGNSSSSSDQFPVKGQSSHSLKGLNVNTNIPQIRVGLPVANLSMRVKAVLPPAESVAYHQFLKFMNEGDWAKILSFSNYIQLATKALQLGAITPAQFATVSFAWCIEQEEDLLGIQHQKNLLKPSSNRDEFFQLIQETLIFEHSERIQQNGNLPISNKNFQVFKERVLKLPESEQILFYLGNYQSHLPAEEITILDAFSKVSFNPLNYTSDGGRILCSFSIAQEINGLLFRDQAFEMVPIFGLSTRDEMVELIKKDLSPIAIFCPGIPIPREIDGHMSLPSHVSYHDYYHTLHRGLCGKEHVKLFIQFGDLLEQELQKLESKNPSENIREMIQIMQGMLIDAEFSSYGYNAIKDRSAEKREIAFWQAIQRTFEEAFPRLNSFQEIHKDPVSGPVFDIFLKASVSLVALVNTTFKNPLNAALAKQIEQESLKINGETSPTFFWRELSDRLQ